MVQRLVTLLVATSLLLPFAAHAQDEDVEPEVEFFFPARKQVTIGVMEFKGVGLSQDKAEIIADIVAEYISKLGDLRVVSKADINSMLNLEKQKRLAGCTDKECFAEIAGALGMPWMVTGSISRFGDSYVLNLKLIDIRNSYVAGRVTKRTKGGEDDLLDEIPDATQELFEKVAYQMGLPIGAKTVTSSARHRQPIGESPSAITVITREDIEASGATNIPDLLRLVPGMDVVTTSPAYSSISTRLLFNVDSKHFLVLIDGREVNLELFGYAFFELQPVSLQDIQRIEIIRGPGSSLYGANAFVGVVSITTRVVPEHTSAWIQVSGGEPGLAEFGAQASTRLGPWGVSLSAGGTHMGIYTDPKQLGREQWKLRSVLDYRLSDSQRLVLDAGFINSKGPIFTPFSTIHVDIPNLALRLAYESDDFKGQIFWNFFDLDGEIRVPLELNQVRLAEFSDIKCFGHTVDGEVQWTLPRLIESLLIILGGGGRVSYLASDNFLDGDTFADIGSPRYHEPGVAVWEGRGGAFVHGEFAPADWVTVTGGLRFDYNTVTKEFLSPRLAAVLRPTAGQFIRVGVARSFRKPAFLENGLHVSVSFPDDSPLTGPGRIEFQEFMTRVIGNENIRNEDIVSFETGYLGRFWEGKLAITVDLFCNINRNRVSFTQDIVTDATTGLPDLDHSRFTFMNLDENLYVFGGELSIRYQLSKNLSLLAWWSHRQYYLGDEYLGRVNPKNNSAFGGRFRTDFGLFGSLYAFSRSEFWADEVENPDGMLEPMLKCHMDNYVLLLGKIGWKIPLGRDSDLEAGVRLFLPVSFSAPHFRYRERGGGVTYSGKVYGGEELARMVTAYMQGSF